MAGMDPDDRAFMSELRGEDHREFLEEVRAERAAVFRILDRLDEGGAGAGA